MNMDSSDYIELGNDACDRGEYGQAIVAYSLVIETGEHLIDAYLCRAFAHEKLDNWQSAVDDYTSGIAQCGDSTLAWLFYRKRACVYTKMNRYEAAVDDYTKAIESLIENPEIVSIVEWNEDGLMLSTEHELTDEEISTIKILCQERSEAYRKLGRIDLAKADKEVLRLNNG